MKKIEKTYLDDVGTGHFLSKLKSLFSLKSHSHKASDIGLGNVNNTSDADKPISTAQQAEFDKINTELGKKISKEDGKSLIADTEIARLASVDNYDDTDIRTELANKADITAIPSKVSELTNDSNYQTAEQVNSTVTTEIAKVVADAPESLDTLKELSDWIADHEDDASAMNSAIQDNKNNIEKKLDKNQLDDTLTKEGYAADSKAVGDELVKKTFVAVKGETSFSDIQEAYNAKKIVLCTDGWLITKLDILVPDNYAQFSGLDDNGNPVLLKVTKDNNWTRINVTKATTDYVNDRIESVNATIANQKTFVAEYGVTTYEELLNAFKSNKQLILHVPYGTVSETQPEMYASLARLDGGGDIRNFVFVCSENSAEHHFVMSHEGKSWTAYDTVLATNDYAKLLDKSVQNLSKNLNDKISFNYKNISANSKAINDVSSSVSSIGKYIAGKDPLLSELSNMNTVYILNSVYNFRGGMRSAAGTMHIIRPGIYLIFQGGTGNKQIIIKNGTTEVLNKTWNGIIVLAFNDNYGNIAITPIGIKSSSLLSGSIEMPGTFQGWTSDGKYSTTINYPAKCVVAYLGNSNVNYLE